MKLHHCYEPECPYYFDGRTAQRARKPIHTTSLLESEGRGPESIADQYSAAVAAYVSGNISHEVMSRLALSAVRVTPRAQLPEAVLTRMPADV